MTEHSHLVFRRFIVALINCATGCAVTARTANGNYPAAPHLLKRPADRPLTNRDAAAVTAVQHRFPKFTTKRNAAVVRIIRIPELVLCHRCGR